MQSRENDVEQALKEARREMFLALCSLLHKNDVSYVILSGYDSYPDQIDSDVDFLIPEGDLERVTSLLHQPGSIRGSRLVQVLEHETTARYFVFAMQLGSRLAFLHPDAAASVRKDGRLRLTSSKALATRRWSSAGFWIPAPAVEFEYYFVKRIEKELLQTRHLEILRSLLREDPEGCTAVLVELIGEAHAGLVVDRIVDGSMDWFAAQAALLREWVMKAPPLESAPARLHHRLADALRILRRARRPTGLVVAVLGADGSGKTTVLDHLGRELAPAFRRVRRYHLRPHFGRSRPGVPVDNPHGEEPRGWLLSCLKMAMFYVDYLWGWAWTIWPDSVRSTLVLFDRYFQDMLADPRRYRLPSTFPVARWVAPLVPSPHVWLVLMAPADTLVSRKGELTVQSANALGSAYKSLASSLPGAVLIDAGQPVAEVLEQALTAVCSSLEARMQRRARLN